MVAAKRWILVEEFHGEPKLSNFRLEEEELQDTLNDGEFLIEALFLSVDPYMRIYKVAVGEVMTGVQVSKVLESKNEKFVVGSLVLANVGWRTKTIVSDVSQILPTPPLSGLSPSAGLGVLGITGLSAYFGLIEICEPKAGQTVLVSGAAGAVGSIVGQIAKLKGCTVIGFAGTSEKCRWLKELGFDHVFNYKDVDIDETLKNVAPDGIDCYFDNVGGNFTAITLKHMKQFGRIALCGAISSYNAKEVPKVPSPWMDLVKRRTRAEGFNVIQWISRWTEGFKALAQWIKEGKIKTRETITDGFDKMPQAFMSMLKGGNIGKAVVKA